MLTIDDVDMLHVVLSRRVWRRNTCSTKGAATAEERAGTKHLHV